MDALTPKRVSPLLRTARWAAFITGIVYGYKHLNTLFVRETKIQADYDIIRAKRAIRLAAEQIVANEKEKVELCGILGVVPPVKK